MHSIFTRRLQRAHAASRFSLVLIFLFCIMLSFPQEVRGHSFTSTSSRTSDFPTVNPDYVYDQLFYMVTHFQHREAGYSQSGHDAFAAYWTQEITRNLQGFNPQVYKDTFKTGGWLSRATTNNAFNIEVTVPGVTHPGQAVVIGCHYDGEASSTQSANDDASGCAIELGVAQALSSYWHSHHVAPARTLRFVIFDAEEQGLFGSFHYLNSTINGDVSNVVAMFNEEQNGIAYPLRYLGQANNPTLPLYVDTSPLHNSPLYPGKAALTQTQQDAITRFNTLMQQAISVVFAQFRALGYQELTYHGSDGHDSAQPIFTPDQTSNLHLEEDKIGGSDQVPFTFAGIPCATFAGNYSYYNKRPTLGSYPFDQPQDTIQMMNTFADGSSQKAHALTLALALPGMLTTWMLHQPDILGETSTSNQAGVTISDIGPSQVGKALTLHALTTGIARQSTTYSWNFDDGTTANGATVSHTYTQPGAYQLTLTTHNASEMHTVVKTLQVVTQSITYPNLYGNYLANGLPPSNPAVTLPTANDSLTDAILRSSNSTVTTTGTQSSQSMAQFLSPIYLFLGIFLLIVAVAGIVSVTRLRTRKPKA